MTAALAAEAVEPARNKRLTVWLPESLVRAVKIAAAVDGKTVTAWVSDTFTAALPKYAPGTHQ